jgi:hypothetical protein
MRFKNPDGDISGPATAPQAARLPKTKFVDSEQPAKL